MRKTLSQELKAGSLYTIKSKHRILSFYILLDSLKTLKYLDIQCVTFHLLSCPGTCKY